MPAVTDSSKYVFQLQYVTSHNEPVTDEQAAPAAAHDLRALTHSSCAKCGLARKGICEGEMTQSCYVLSAFYVNRTLDHQTT